jgi:hypothetical protein
VGSRAKMVRWGPRGACHRHLAPYCRLVINSRCPPVGLSCSNATLTCATPESSWECQPRWLDLGGSRAPAYSQGWSSYRPPSDGCNRGTGSKEHRPWQQSAGQTWRWPQGIVRQWRCKIGTSRALLQTYETDGTLAVSADTTLSKLTLSAGPGITLPEPKTLWPSCHMQDLRIVMRHK